MDWLFRHSASVDCRLKRITLLARDGETVEIMGVRLDDSVRLVSAVKAQRMIRKGCQAFLAHVMDIESPVPSLQDTPAVRDFTDVFLYSYQDCLQSGK